MPIRLNRTWWITVLLLSLSCRAQAQTKDPLAAQVTIYRDTYGVPHIVGETQEATFFGYGYAQAQDHLEEMMLQYRDAQGRRAGPDKAVLVYTSRHSGSHRVGVG